jgi:hypothetical protein
LKRILIVLGLLFFLTGPVSNASALYWSDTNYLNQVLGDNGNFESYSWTHLLPSDFEVPPDTVNYASLLINATGSNGNNDQVEVEGTLVGYLDSAHLEGSWFNWTWVNTTDSYFEVTDAFSSWEKNSVLNVTVNATELFCFNSLTLNYSKLEMWYEKGSDPISTPVPEPATIMLLGIGLMGLVGETRKKVFR